MAKRKTRSLNIPAKYPDRADRMILGDGCIFSTDCRKTGLNNNWCCTIKVDIGNSKSQYIEKDKQEATKDGSESTKIQHGI